MIGGAVPVVVVTATIGALASVVLARWLGRRSYRTEGEREVRPTRTWWILPVVVSAEIAVAAQLGGRIPVLVTYGVAVIWMVGLAAIDLDVRRLPDLWTLPGAVGATALLAWCAWGLDDWSRWGVAIACGAASGAVYLILALINPAGLGLGDVKLAVPLGMLTGWFGVPVAVGGFLLAFTIGLFVAIGAAIRSGEGRKATFPFGPSMLAGTVLVVLLLGSAAG